LLLSRRCGHHNTFEKNLFEGGDLVPCAQFLGWSVRVVLALEGTCGKDPAVQGHPFWLGFLSFRVLPNWFEL